MVGISQRRRDLGFDRDSPFVDRKWMMLYTYAARIDYEKRVNKVEDSVFQTFFHEFPGLQYLMVSMPRFSTRSSREALLCLLMIHNEERRLRNLSPLLETPMSLMQEFVGQKLA
eukprot:Protomagalhaensia_sp_Gyna_25__4679@NODE_444_length_3415_cov_19_715640_g341_i0_p5_GENE_NODE_444_length_3415_cov_19_715640_g341_i0NODE_444_length_3415_cov_19_715640_g341_i0_p5_ORF_typecomplete_len114_score22_71Evr1_Alr/PF04777_13/0_14_NODE_444_length_3415_cov_19_715640_g341_i024365